MTQSLVPVSDSWLTPFAGWVTPTGLRELPDDLSYDDWAKLGLYIGTVFTASKWALGDWLNFGEHRFGEKYVQAAEATGRSEQGLMNIASTCKAYPDAQSRAREVPFGLFEETAKIARADPVEADSILARAEEGKWTREELRAELAPSVVPGTPSPRKLSLDEIEAKWAERPDKAETRNSAERAFSAFMDWMRS